MTTTGTLTLTTPTDREIVMTRVFPAPRSLVFEAFTTPELLKRWLLGPPGWSMIVCEVDAKVGGNFRYVWRNVDGSEMGMHGSFREIVRPERIVHVESFDYGCDSQAGEQLITTILSEQDGKTLFTATILYPTKEARDQMIASGMERGVSASYDRLEEVLAARPISAA